LLKSKEVAEKAYRPVKKYIAYLKGLEMLEIVGINAENSILISGARREIRLVALRFIPSSNDERVRDKVYRN